MELNNRYNQLFGKIPILGMIHLAGTDPVTRALEEIAIFSEEGVDGAIIENYYGDIGDVRNTLQELNKIKLRLVIGINILPNEFHRSFALAKEYKADFIQIDRIAGTYISGQLNFEKYELCKKEYPEIIVLGGVWPKYYHPIENSDIEKDLQTGMQRAEAIVVTGDGTGIETPLYKIKQFRKIIGKHPLVIGAGLNLGNAYDQLIISDGAIIGTSLKIDNKIIEPIDREKVEAFMKIVKKARTYQENQYQQ